MPFINYNEFLELCVEPNISDFLIDVSKLMEISSKDEDTTKLQSIIKRKAWNAAVTLLHFFEWRELELTGKKDIKLIEIVNNFKSSCPDIEDLYVIGNSYKHKYKVKFTKPVKAVQSSAAGTKISENKGFNLPWGEALLFSPPCTLLLTVNTEMGERALDIIIKNVYSFAKNLK